MDFFKTLDKRKVDDPEAFTRRFIEENKKTQEN